MVKKSTYENFSSDPQDVSIWEVIMWHKVLAKLKVF